jgi:hypothetical protein
VTLRAPFPWFGGKRLVAPMVWERFGDVPNYVEPFFGSGAVLLGRPTPPRVETVNDKDALLANFWRAVQADPESVAHWADWPISEPDLHSRHLFLVDRRSWLETMMTDPTFYDVQIAGWWVWGLCQWIGGGWCAPIVTDRAAAAARDPGQIHRKHPDLRQHVGMTGEGAAGRGVHAQTQRRRPRVSRGQGIARTATPDGRQRPQLIQRGGTGVHGLCLSPRRQLPDLQTDSGAAGKGVNASGGPSRKRPRLQDGGGGGPGVFRKRPALSDRGGIQSLGRAARHGLASTSGVAAERTAWLIDLFIALSDRLRNVRIVAGEWDRVLGPTPTWKTGLTGILLDPPYSLDERDGGLYATEADDTLADRVRAWAIENGENPLLRIAFCGYDTEHGGSMPRTWTALRWKSHGGYGSQGRTSGRAQANSRREVIWFSPHCLSVGMFDEHVYQLAEATA